MYSSMATSVCMYNNHRQQSQPGIPGINRGPRVVTAPVRPLSATGLRAPVTCAKRRAYISVGTVLSMALKAMSVIPGV